MRDATIITIYYNNSHPLTLQQLVLWHLSHEHVGDVGSVSALKEDRMSPKAPCLLPRKYEGHRVL